MEYEESDDGDRERKIVDHQIWSLPQLMDNLLVIQKVLKEVWAMRGDRSWCWLRGCTEPAFRAVISVAAQEGRIVFTIKKERRSLGRERVTCLM